MGSSYSDLILYFKCKDENNQASKNGQTDKYTITTKKENYEGCVNYLKVTHEIKFNNGTDGSDYNVLLYDGNEKNRGNRVFGYYYPDKSKVLKEVHVYYSVLETEKPLVISFVIQSGQTYNFTNDSLTSTRWCKAYNITYYSLGHSLTTNDLTNEFKKLQWNRKIQFEVGTNVVQVSGSKQELNDKTNYRYVFTPNGDNSVLGSNCLFKLNSDKPKCSETNNRSEPPKPQPQTQTNGNVQANSSSKYDNEIDQYYLDTFNGQFFDGIMVYFAKENTSNGQKPGGNRNNGANQNHNDDMALLLEFVNNCSTNKFLKRNDKEGTYWTECNVDYKDDATLKAELTKIQDATKNDMTTFVLEKKDSFKGVTIKKEEQGKSTYTKYTHTAKESKKPNILFQKNPIEKFGIHSPPEKTKTLDVYFLKVQGKEEEYPFLLFFSEKDNQTQQSHQQPPQQQQQQQPPQATTSSNGSTSPKENNKKCYFFNNAYDFKNWQELKVDKAPEKKEEKETLDKKLEEKLAKIESSGSCAQEINYLRSIAYYILIGKEEKAKEPPPPEKKKNERPKVLSSPKVHGPTVVQILGYVTAGLVVKGSIGGGLYGIYWYNTTIKLLT